EPAVEPVDQVGHSLEPLGDHPEPVLAEVLRLDLERARKRGHDVVRRDRAVPVDEVVEVPGGEPGTGGQLAVGDPLLVHEPLHCLAEPLLAEAPSLSHVYPPVARSATFNLFSSPLARLRTSTFPSSRLLRPAVTRIGQPMRSASANFSPARWSRSS